MAGSVEFNKPEVTSTKCKLSYLIGFWKTILLNHKSTPKYIQLLNLALFSRYLEALDVALKD